MIGTSRQTRNEKLPREEPKLHIQSHNISLATSRVPCYGVVSWVTCHDMLFSLTPSSVMAPANTSQFGGGPCQSRLASHFETELGIEIESA